MPQCVNISDNKECITNEWKTLKPEIKTTISCTDLPITESDMLQKLCYHNDVIQWKNIPRYWPFVRVMHRCHRWFPSQRPVTRSFDGFYDVHLNKRMIKQSICRWFETPWRSLWRHCNDSMQYEVRDNIALCGVHDDYYVMGIMWQLLCYMKLTYS